MSKTVNRTSFSFQCFRYRVLCDEK